MRLADPRHGSLPVLLLVLTAVTGVMDAVSILTLDRVFVANMTGNVVFAGFAIADVEGFSLLTTLVVLGAFLVGATAGGLLSNRTGSGRGELLRTAVLAETVLLTACLVVVLTAAPAPHTAAAIAIATISAVAMGLQNAVARRIAVPDLNTNVVTLTMTGLVADRRRAGAAALTRRTAAVLALLAGAVIGVLVLNAFGAGAAFGLIVVVLAGVALAVHALLRRGPDWEC